MNPKQMIGRVGTLSLLTADKKLTEQFVRCVRAFFFLPRVCIVKRNNAPTRPIIHPSFIHF